MFEHYMSPEVVDKLIAKPEMLRLGGEKKELTVLFSDVQGFTTISERLKPEQLVDLLNVYLGAMTELIMKSGGTLDKYEGDAIMAFWGAPVDQPDNAKRACFTAIDMQKKLSQMREVWKKEGKPELITRIGLNTGEMIVGNMGSAERFDYTVMGDAVNLGSRLEGANKQYGTNIMIGEMTYLRAKDYIITRELDKITVKGKLLPVKVYELIAKKEDGISKEMEELLNLYNEGLKAYTERRWNDGILLFSKALEIKPDDGPSKTYLERCQNYLNNPPPDDWDGVYVMKTK